ncbi:MAG: hypothetical protein LUC16_02665 [Coprobacillus sp.]|nr:hypothetical protein [Coprobacillus sp.]
MASNNNAERREMLDQVNAAITSILVGGQSYKIGSRTLTRADLNALKDLRNELESEAADRTPWLMDDTYLAFFPGR